MRIANTQKIIITTAKNINQNTIYILKCSEPEAKIKIIYSALNYKSKPKIKQKFVVLKIEPEQMDLQINKRFASG